MFSPSMTIQLIANIDKDNEYIGFGFSPKGSSQMVGSDVAIAYYDGNLGYVDDYNITAKSPCSGILGVKKASAEMMMLTVDRMTTKFKAMIITREMV